MSETAAVETRADVDGTAGEVRLWLDAIHLSRKTEEDWRKKKAENAVQRYRDEEKRTERRFNILFANVQTILPAVYNSTPIPDVRRRFGEPDPVGKAASTVLERSVSYFTDTYDFDGCMRAACWDMEVPGRGTVRVRYEPTFDGDDNLADEAVTCEYVDWRDFVRGPGRRWSEVPWVAFEHRLTREELADKFGAVGKTMPLDIVCDGAEDSKDPRDVPEVFKRGLVYEVWDKQRREVLFVAPSQPDRYLKREPDPLRLRDFFPLPRPIQSIMETGSLVPLVPFELYRDQAMELDRVTGRITDLVAMVKWRGLRAADLPEWSSLADAQDGSLLAVENWQQFAGGSGAGGLDKAIWLVPIEQLVATIKELVIHREQIKQVIYEITGLSDIIRGASEASETATAQRIKSQWGSLRVEDRQSEVRRFARDLFRLMSEIIAEHFQPQTLAMMTGVELPTAQVKQQAQMALAHIKQAAGAQVPGQPPAPPPDPAMVEHLQSVVQQPSWEEVMQLLRSDALRSYRVDIETDSTVQADVARMQENAAQFVQGFGAFVQSVGPAVQSGFFPMDVAADLLQSFARNFKLGRQAEDAIERLKTVKPPQQPAQDNGEAIKAQVEKQKLQLQAQKQQAEAKLKAAELQQDGQIAREEMAAEAQMQREQIASDQAIERQRMAVQAMQALHQADDERERFHAEGQRADALERERMAAGERQALSVAEIRARATNRPEG